MSAIRGSGMARGSHWWFRRPRACARFGHRVTKLQEWVAAKGRMGGSKLPTPAAFRRRTNGRTHPNWQAILSRVVYAQNKPKPIGRHAEENSPAHRPCFR